MAKPSNLTKHQLEIISAVASEEAVKMYVKKAALDKKEEKKRNLRNTELLLKNYLKLKELCEETTKEIQIKEVLSGSTDDYEELLDFSLENLTLESLNQYRAKTLMMMKHVDKMLVAYEWNCSKGSVEEQRRFNILKHRYLIEDKLTVKEICKEFNVEQGTVYRDTKISIKDMSVLLFGIDAIDFQ